ncbi:hypothetical protein [Arthrobacter sp. NA-172]|uniref:hypothetical protein n=1 Tax=Arthrobacter sp. NA-172 TaxID=3367524 RepID=UPI0037547D1D
MAGEHLDAVLQQLGDNDVRSPLFGDWSEHDAVAGVGGPGSSSTSAHANLSCSSSLIRFRATATTSRRNSAGKGLDM